MLDVWWASLTGVEQALWIVAIPTSLLFIIKLVLTLLGIDGDEDFDVDAVDVDIDGESSGSGIFSSIFSTQNLLPFFLGFSWSGLALLDYLQAEYAILGAVFSGTVVVVLNALLIGLLYSLKSSGNLQLSQAVGTEATVSVRVPADEQGFGKVSLSMQGRLVELEATTTNVSPIDRGTKVVVVAVDGQFLQVNPA